MAGASVFDLIIIAVLAVGIWRGSRTGAVRQVAAVVGLVAAVWLGLLLMVPVGAALASTVLVPEEMGPLVGFIMVAGLVVLCVTIVGMVGRKTLSFLRLGFLDSGLGAALGAAKMALWASLLILLTSAPLLPGGDGHLLRPETREASLLYEPIRAVAPALWRGLQAATPGVASTYSDVQTDKPGARPASDGR